MGLVLPKIGQLMEEGSMFLAIIHNFASGVIFAAAVFLLLPEGLYLTAVDKTEAGGNGAWGTALMSGWFFCVIIKHLGQIIATKRGERQGHRLDRLCAHPLRGLFPHDG